MAIKYEELEKLVLEELEKVLSEDPTKPKSSGSKPSYPATAIKRQKDAEAAAKKAKEEAAKKAEEAAKAKRKKENAAVLFKGDSAGHHTQWYIDDICLKRNRILGS